MPSIQYTVAAVAAVAVAAIAVPAGLFFVDEGSVAAVYFGGALTDSLLMPGYHWTAPILTTRAVVTTRMQTSIVSGVPCGSKSGVMLTFDTIEVVHRLDASDVLQTLKEYGPNYEQTWVRDRIRSEVNQLCSQLTLAQITVEEFDHIDDILMANLQTGLRNFNVGVQIQAVRVTKPHIPAVVKRNYEKREAEVARLKVVTQAAEREIKEAETAAKREVSHAEKQKEVALIDSQRRVEVAESELHKAKIDDKMVVARGKSQADALKYSILKQAESEAQLLSPDYLEYLRAKTEFANMKMFVGTKVPDAIIEETEPTPATALHGSIQRHMAASSSASSSRSSGA